MRLLNPLAWWQGDKPKSKARRTPARRPGARNAKRGLRKGFSSPNASSLASASMAVILSRRYAATFACTLPSHLEM